MKLGVVKRIAKEDMLGAKDLPKWLDYFLPPLNEFIEKVGLALLNRLTFADNILGKQADFTFTHNVEQEINPYPSTKGSLAVIGIVPVSTGGVFIVGFKWIQKQNGNVGVTVQLSGATTAKIRLQIQLG